MKKYGLVGKSLSHSFSKHYFEHKFSAQKIQATYQNMELNEISDNLKFKLNSFAGVNVTIPYKEEVITHLDRIEGVAAEIKAVNTIKIMDGQLIGYNTDVFGFQQMIKPFFKSQHERAMVLGTGGASKAVAHALLKLGCQPIFISRNPKTENEFAYEDVNEQMLTSCKIIVNTTPLGTFPNVTECPDIPFNFLTTEHLAIDLIYNPTTTQFLKNAQNHGAVILNGKTMLEQQAEESWRIWNE